MTSFDELASAFGNLSREMVRDWRSEIDRRLRQIGLSHAKWLTLYQASLGGPAPTQTELAARLGVEGPTLVRQLDRMEAAGLSLRQADPDDRRRKVVRLTSAGEEFLGPVQEVLLELRRNYLAGVNPNDLATCLKVLAQIRENQARASSRAASNGAAPSFHSNTEKARVRKGRIREFADEDV